MKTSKLCLLAWLVCFACIVGGCRTESFEQNLKRFESIRRGMSEVEVVALLGEPVRQVSQVSEWEDLVKLGDEHEYALLLVAFDGQRRVIEVHVSHTDITDMKPAVP
jgi:hypothetical protein